jgi:hypothetical protein
MPFVKADPNINRKGRALGTSNKAMSKRDIKERELISLVRKVKPHVATAIARAVSIMGNNEAAHANQLKAAVLILQQYRDLVKDIYDVEDDTEEGTEIQPAAPVFSLRMINNDVNSEDKPEEN